MITVDFHSHSIFSKDCLTSLESLIRVCDRKHINRIVITDHNTIEGANLAKVLDPVHIIIGEEIKTKQGELLGLFLKEGIPGGLSASETIKLLKDQGAFISVSHPFDRLRNGHWNLSSLLEILPMLDSIETFNARCMTPGANGEAEQFAQYYHIGGTAGSDAHTPHEIGAAMLKIPEFWDPESLRLALPKAQFMGHQSGYWVHFFSYYARWRKRMMHG